MIPAGHRLIHHESREANCTEPGNIEYWSCERCGKLFGDENGANEISADSVTVGTASGHSLTRHEAHAPTCTEDGNIEYWSCNRCAKYFADGNGNTETDEENVTVNALGHDWGEWQITKEPTETEEGEKERVCRREGCDAKVVVAIPANNQDPGESQVSYYFTDDSQFTWTKGGESGMLVIVKNTVAGDDGDTFEKMSRVLVDGRELDSGNYTAIEGSIRLTLKPAYLQSIDTGEHTLKVELARRAAATPIQTPTKIPTKTLARSRIPKALSQVKMISLSGAVWRCYCFHFPAQSGQQRVREGERRVRSPADS